MRLHTLFAIERAAAWRLDGISEEFPVDGTCQRGIRGWSFSDVGLRETLVSGYLSLPRSTVGSMSAEFTQVRQTEHVRVRLCDDVTSFRSDHNTLAKGARGRVIDSLEEAARYTSRSLDSRSVVKLAVVVGRTVLDPVTY